MPIHYTIAPERMKPLRGAWMHRIR